MTPLAERFKTKYEPVTESGCWIWTGAVHNLGYGSIGIGGRHGKVLAAHRASWMLHHGEIPPDTDVLHKCDVRCCVNPHHLFLGNHADNMRDMKEKKRGRSVRGARNHNAKLTEEQAPRIRNDPRSDYVICEEYGVSPAAIWLIKKRRNWKHV